jgi:hypothetical protein
LLHVQENGVAVDAGMISINHHRLARRRRRTGVSPLREQAEALSLDAERRIELAAEVFERDCCGQFDDLRLAEPRF